MSLVLNRRYWLMLTLSMILGSSCAPMGPYGVAKEEIPAKEEKISTEQSQSKQQASAPEPIISTPKKPDLTESPSAEPKVSTEKITKVIEPHKALKEEEKHLPEKKESPPSREGKDQPASTDRQQVQENNQDLLDSALDYCQASNDFWEQGDLDNAIDALDKAYSLILKVNQNGNPEMLQQKEDLRYTISKRIIEVYASRFTVVNGHYKAIPLVMNKHVERALNLFKGRDRRFFLDAYRRSGRYRPAIVRALKEGGLPEELSWLPLIESGFKVRAFSRARALGLWQFIASTGYKFGLKRGPYIDERMDPEKSTRAAIAYLKELHKIFGDWTTVLAAYNCGELRVLNQIRKQRINYLDNFWDLYEQLPRETAFYVPKFLAVLHILSDPRHHGLTLPPLDKEMVVEQVTIDKQIHLKTIASRLDIGYSVLKSLNPELRHNLTPKSPYPLKVPSGKGALLHAKLKEIPVWEPPVPPYIVHRVKRGDSLSVIAQRYNTSIRAIMAVNGLKKSHYLKVGWRLKIPTKKVYLATVKKTPAFESSSKGKLIEYEVKTGDSLWKIANRYNTTTKAIRSLNRLQHSTLQIGQVLMISTGQTTQKPNKTYNYKVRKGDSPYLIAKRHKMNLADFLKLNHLTPRSTIFPGQIVRISVE